MNYFDTFSGIGSASVAWGPLGWRALAHAENAPFPAAVLKHHFPGVRNLGDCTRFKEWPDFDEAVDVVCGGTPCQTFSIAGLRAGLSDPRGQLTLTFLAIVDRFRPRWLVWENTLGVLSDDDGRSFASILSAVGLIGYGWAYRVLNAEFCRVDGLHRAVPQRRRRVYLVGYLGDWTRPASVLFEPARVQRNHPPRRKARQEIAPPLSARPTGGGGFGTDFEVDGGLIAGTVSSKWAKQSGGPAGDEAYNLVVEPASPLVGFSAKDYGSDALVDTAPTLRAMGHDKSHANAGGQLAVAFQPRFARNGRGGPSAIAPALTAEPGSTGKGDSAPCVATADSVRRLTPLECERLMGLPDGWTDIPWRGQAHAPDGPRYKALGNGWAINTARWVGMRMAWVDRLAVGGAD